MFCIFAAHAGRVGGQRGAKLTHRKEEKTQTAENRGEDYRASDDTESLSSLLISQVTMKKRNLGGREDRKTTELRPSVSDSLCGEKFDTPGVERLQEFRSDHFFDVYSV